MKRIGFLTVAMALVMFAASAVFAEDEVMKRAQGMFKPVPCSSAGDERKILYSRKGGIGQDALFRAETLFECPHKLQYLSQCGDGRC